MARLDVRYSPDSTSEKFYHMLDNRDFRGGIFRVLVIVLVVNLDILAGGVLRFTRYNPDGRSH
jgi:hypothetical protein